MEKQLLSASRGAVVVDVRSLVVVDMKDSRKIGRVGSAPVNQFWRRANGFFAFQRCTCLIAPKLRNIQSQPHTLFNIIYHIRTPRRTDNK